MPTLILSPRHTADSQILWRGAMNLGWATERLPSWSVPPHFKEFQEPILYTEALFYPLMNEFFGVNMHEPPEDWLPNLPMGLRKREIKLTNLGEVRTLTKPTFIKPPNDKCFAAQVFEKSEDFPVWFPDEQRILASEVVEWEKEFRCFMLDNKVKTLSVYLRDGVVQREADFQASDEELAEAKEFAELVASKVAMPDAIVIDVGVIKDRGWAAVEVNAAWGSGVYGCEPQEVLEVVRRSMR